MRLRKPIAKLLARERICRAATAGKDGVPHVVPVCHTLADGKIYFGTGSDSMKAQNLQANPHLAIVVDLYSEDWDFLKGVMIQGTAKLIRRGPQFRKIRALLYQKYSQYPDDAALEEADSVLVEMTPVRMASWGIERKRE